VIGERLELFRADPERMKRLSVSVVATAFVMLGGTLFYAAGGDLPEQTNVAPQAVFTSLLPLEPAVATPYDCQRLRNGQWLQVVIIHRDQKGFEHYACLYGRVQFKAGEANL